MLVCAKQCKKCLFGKNKIVSNARKIQILQQTAREGTHFICHEATIAKLDVCCRGFYETMGSRSQLVRIAQRLGVVRFVDPKTGKPSAKERVVRRRHVPKEPAEQEE